jgi:hypothetical protein
VDNFLILIARSGFLGWLIPLNPVDAIDGSIQHAAHGEQEFPLGCAAVFHNAGWEE